MEPLASATNLVTYQRKKKGLRAAAKVEAREREDIREAKDGEAPTTSASSERELPAADATKQGEAWLTRTVTYRRSSLTTEEMRSRGAKELQQWARESADADVGDRNSDAGDEEAEATPREDKRAAARRRPGMWAERRPTAAVAKERAAAALKRSMEYWSSYFHEVDQFDLAEESPDKPAGKVDLEALGVPAPTRRLSYLDLQRQSRAAQRRATGVGPDAPVAAMAPVPEEEAEEGSEEEASPCTTVPSRASWDTPGEPSEPLRETGAGEEAAVPGPRTPAGRASLRPTVPAFHLRNTRRSSVLLLPKTPAALPPRVRGSLRMSMAPLCLDAAVDGAAVPRRPSVRPSLGGPRPSVAPHRPSTLPAEGLQEEALAEEVDAVAEAIEGLQVQDACPALTIAEAAAVLGRELTPLEMLLTECGQGTDTTALPTIDELLGRHVDLDKVSKIGEGTFGEAFKGPATVRGQTCSTVFKIVPMEGATLVNGEKQKTADEMLAEVAVTLRLSGLRRQSDTDRADNKTAGFVEAFTVGVCRGRYAKALLVAWRAWDAKHRSENDCPDMFGDDQLYVVFVVADGGVDLERFELCGFEECRAALLQVAMSLAVAEEACEFEHRDLHWGNVLLSREAEPGDACFRLNGVDVSCRTAGVRVTLIDFTLSRLCTPDGAVAFCDLGADPELFQGPKGNCQANTYRRMRKLTRGKWAGFFPGTNALWMHYLADAMLSLKAVRMSAQETRSLKTFKRRALGYASCAELIWDELFEGQWDHGDA